MDEYRVVIFLVSSLSIPKIDCCLKCHKSKLSQKKKKLNIIYRHTHITIFITSQSQNENCQDINGAF